jgi:hypothetical protein
MAKGLRSKVKRANRTSLRERLTLPIQKKRQEEISKKIEEDLALVKGNTMTNLRNKLSGFKHEVKIVELPKLKEEFNPESTKTTKKKGSKPRNNPGKELVWFK